MKISILCSSPEHPVNAWLEDWAAANRDRHEVEIIHAKRDASGGDLLFLVSCGEIINANDRARYTRSLVIHASDLPDGRGWSPHIWQIADGARELTVTLLEAEDKVDSGAIWKQERITIHPSWLYDEINVALFKAELDLMDFATANFDRVEPRRQVEKPHKYYRKRTMDDSRIDPNRSIAEQFNLIRACDPVRFPAFFELNGRKYRLIVERY
jgi:methionyl-tRNA formyltransferase